MGRFLWGGGGFQGILSSFGRPRVRHWTGIGVERGAAFGAKPYWATRHGESLAPDADPRQAVNHELDRLRDLGRDPAVALTALALDPDRWQLVRFTLWVAEPPAAVDGLRYQVLHLSTPELERILPKVSG